MLKGFYTATSGMLSMQYRQDQLTNNLANSNTPGFKADQSVTRSFPTMLMQANNAYQNPSRQVVGELPTAVYLQEHLMNAQQGDIQQTGQATDLALVQGGATDGAAVFFAVETENGIRYTRNGNFQVDLNGNLVTASGGRVLGTDGNPLQVGNESFTIQPSGIVVVDGEEIGSLEVVVADDVNDLIKEGNGYVRNDQTDMQSAYNVDTVTFSVQQYALENSNVDVTSTMNEMLQAYRLFEANQKVIQAYDQSLEKTVNEVGRIN
ncbi:flagellar hook-basal body protein [Shouchella lehensis]|uniref:Flagellar hook-basal body protein n=1 Tax=Shouchella lehensis TaxID=300825 RepID=A0A4Y7WF45_9BACI|nr:flagellar hook-basal body protein [Shouchella lehensis]MBG9785139.1 hypothetical protein [Shouchella lehensis]TES46575.1 flagellar hook-basal body protein [Shouchella lehensis]